MYGPHKPFQPESCMLFLDAVFTHLRRTSLFAKYGNVIQADSTYQGNRGGYHLWHVVITDCNGVGRSLFYSFIRSESQECYDVAVEHFVRMMCPVNVGREVGEFEVYATSIRSRNQEFWSYLSEQWLTDLSTWAKHAVTLGDETTNRVESANRYIKWKLTESSSLLTCVQAIISRNEQFEAKYRRLSLNLDIAVLVYMRLPGDRQWDYFSTVYPEDVAFRFQPLFMEGSWGKAMTWQLEMQIIIFKQCSEVFVPDLPFIHGSSEGRISVIVLDGSDYSALLPKLRQLGIFKTTYDDIWLGSNVLPIVNRI
ncbi:hypothetical protein CLF_106986 [Clonorchis sinensis]|uniref:ZSWIM1/3 RNaseH-like domain-containing protein n=1 Tax=Clonorchis sinensis TaxID=79923 RepID=G7YG20_CLOSI|nr:hypothetical protein CLF_106986 [Clonorchis sinensis]